MPLRLERLPKPVCERSCLEHRNLIRKPCIGMPRKHPKHACAWHIKSESQKTPGTLGMYAHDSLGMQHDLNGLTGSVCTVNAPMGRFSFSPANVSLGTPLQEAAACMAACARANVTCAHSMISAFFSMHAVSLTCFMACAGTLCVVF